MHVASFPGLPWLKSLNACILQAIKNWSQLQGMPGNDAIVCMLMENQIKSKTSERLPEDL